MTHPTAFTLQTVVSQGADILTSDVDGELVMMHVSSGEYFGLDAVSRRIWELVAQPQAIEAVCERLTSEFDVDRATCEAETLEFVGQLAEAGLVKASTA